MNMEKFRKKIGNVKNLGNINFDRKLYITRMYSYAFSYLVREGLIELQNFPIIL
jgi:hypothetical protein